MKKATVIIPTTGSKEFSDCLSSVLNQTYKNTQAYIVVDGNEYSFNTTETVSSLKPDKEKFTITHLSENVGKNGFYGHRVFAAFTHLVNSDYILYLDQDCFMDENHVETMIKTIEDKNLDWCYSLRKIVNKNRDYICNDDCESLGKWNPVMQYNHIDTNCYCIKTSVATKIAQVWHGKWGQDRVFYSVISQHFPNYDCTGKYTMNYRLAGNEGSVKSDFFEQWNGRVNELFGGDLPWRK